MNRGAEEGHSERTELGMGVRRRREGEKVRASEDIATGGSRGSKGVSRACESPNGTHASFDKLSERIYMVMSHSKPALHDLHNIT